MSSAIAVMALAALMILILESAKEQQLGLVEAQLHQEAGLLEDRLTRIIRSMSASESTIFGDPVGPGGPFYRQVIMARGKPPTLPREELRYDPVTMTLIHDPDRSQDGDEIVLHPSSHPMKLRNLFFFPLMKPGGIPDTAAVNVWFELDDDGAGGRKQPDGTPERIKVVRSFVVTMRNH